jgi:hypothetical protein
LQERPKQIHGRFIDTVLDEEEEMAIKNSRIVCPLLGLLMVAVISHAGGVDPKDLPLQTPVVREKVSATPEQTSAAISKARRAVAPDVEEPPAVRKVPLGTPPSRAVTSASRDSWLLSSPEGECLPLESVRGKVKSLGTFKTPQEFSRQMHQRGYRAFILDIGDVRDQMVRVKVPDLDLDLLFVRPDMCR